MTRGRAANVGLFSGLVLVLAAFAAPTNVSGDGASMLAVTESLVTRGSFTVGCEHGIVGAGGACYSTYYPLQSLLAVPFMAAGRALAAVASLPAAYLGSFIALAVPLLAGAATGALTACCAERLGATRRRATLAALTAVFATELAIYWRTFFAEALAACLLTMGLLLLVRSDRWMRAVAPVVALVILAKPQLALALPAASLVVGWRRRSWEPLAAVAIGSLAGLLLYAAYNNLRFGDPLDFGGEARDVDLETLSPASVVEALALLTFSPGRGFLIYSPIAVVGVIACWQLRHVVIVQAGVAAAGGLLAITVTNPGLGSNWGSRYLVPLLPLLVAAAWAAPRLPRALTPTFALLGVLICLPTFVTFYQRYYEEQSHAGRTQAELYWSIKGAPLVGIWGSAGRTIRDARSTDVSELVQEDASQPGSPAFFRVIAQWWWMSPAGHVPRAVSFMFAVIVALAGAALLVRQSARASPGQDSASSKPA